VTEAARPWRAPEGWTIHPGYAARLCADGTEVRVQLRPRGPHGIRYWEVRTWIAAYSCGEAVQGEQHVHGSLEALGPEGREQPREEMWTWADHVAKQHGGWA